MGEPRQEAEVGTRGRARGRKDADKQEQVIKTKIVKDRVDQLVQLKNNADSAATDFNDAVKKAAEDSGLLASSVRKFVVARAGEKFEEEQRKCTQLSLLFEEVGG